MRKEVARTALLLGEDGMDRLAAAHIAVFGLGGVGAAAVEALARAGVGALTVIDNDHISPSNRNRQLIALASTTGLRKTQAMASRVKDIAPDCKVTPLDLFYSPQTALDLRAYTYIVDAIDTVSAKLHLAEQCERLGVPLISSMGTGNKLDPTRFEVADIYETSVCPLARVMRRELKVRGVRHLKVVYSKEEPQRIAPERYALAEGEKKGTAGRPVPASISFVPPVAGMILAGEVIKDIAMERLKPC